MKYILPLLLFCVPAQAEVVREMSNLVTKDNVNGAVALNGVTTVPGGSFSVGVSTFVVTGGKVGVGTASPLVALHILGGAAPAIRVEGTSTPSMQIRDTASGGATWTVYSGFPAVGDYTIREDGVENALTIKKTTRNVGIGTTAPADKLDISSGTIRMAGTGSPAVGYALCLAASGAMGHCTDTPAANGACTCTTP